MNEDVLRRLASLEERTDTHAELISEVRVSLARISTSLESLVSVLRWTPAVVAMIGTLTGGVIWLINHAK